MSAVADYFRFFGRNGTPSITELDRIDLARVNNASGLSLAVLALVQKIGEELHANGTFDVLTSNVPRADTQNLFAPRPE